MEVSFEEAQAAIDKFWTDAERDAEAMWETWKAPHRIHVLQALACVRPFTSVYEVGCGAGPNLRLIRESRPHVRLGGCEPNVGLATWAASHLDATEVDIVSLPDMSTDAWDVLLSVYAMAYAPVEVVEETLKSTSARSVIIVEPSAYVFPFAQPGLQDMPDGVMPCTVHDYPAVLAATGWRMSWRWPIYPHRHGMNAVTIAERD